jgi:Uma2 family endonuclease
MATVHRNVQITPEEYLEGEKYSQVKHEFIDGKVYAMDGVSLAHASIVSNLITTLHIHLRSSPCQVYATDVKVKVGNAFYYPDIMVECDSAADPETYYCEQPIVLAEVLSASTGQRDRTEKRFAYQTIDSLQEYVLIAQDRPDVAVYRRTNAGWDLETLDANDQLRLAAVDLVMPVTELYRGVALPP